MPKREESSRKKDSGRQATTMPPTKTAQDCSRDDAVNVLADVLLDRDVLVDRGDVLVDESAVWQVVGPWKR